MSGLAWRRDSYLRQVASRDFTVRERMLRKVAEYKKNAL
jgi:hypothetical protein